jgi:hypothetical protein
MPMDKRRPARNGNFYNRAPSGLIFLPLANLGVLAHGSNRGVRVPKSRYIGGFLFFSSDDYEAAMTILEAIAETMR